MKILRSRLAVAVLAAATAAAVSGIAPPGVATAKPRYVAEGATALRAENQRLRADLRAYQAAYDELTSGLDRIDAAAARLRDRRARKQLQRLVADARDRAQLSVTGDDDRDDRYGGGRYGGYGDAYERDGQRYYAMGDADFQALRRRVDAASFADDQLDLIKTAATGNLFSADQVVSLMKACTYEDTRIEVAALLYTQLTDPDRAYLIYDGFTYASSKKTLRQRLGQ
ncbi:MAG: DUF4476 domain-containing protein [Kofleriaceae bacterium]|nr:DUF4476 domain-containing protein [Myxococcales bacterium]MCB9563388.1 DUF4476 domain-containing protein [Kofleriaceae bacterium]MCB9573680.1 DUF4476 domain-containing protein [Kofleriaceae bacterium]